MAALPREFPKKPLMQALLDRMVVALQARTDVADLLKNRKTVYGWILSQGWPDIQSALAAAPGLTDGYKACLVGKNTAGAEACFADYEQRLVGWAVIQYIGEAGANPVAYQAAGTGGPPVDESKGMSAGTMVAIGAGVILLGGVGYYAYTKSQKNPSFAESTLKKTLMDRWIANEVDVSTWVERDRASVAVQEAKTGKVLVEWWDEDVAAAVEDGFFKSDRPFGKLEGKTFERSVIEYADHLRIRPYAGRKKKARAKKNPAVRTGHFGYGDKPTKGLRSTLDSPAVEKAVKKLAKASFPRARVLDLVYEHGQWWVIVNDSSTYSVVDTSSGLGLEGT